MAASVAFNIRYVEELAKSPGNLTHADAAVYEGKCTLILEMSNRVSNQPVLHVANWRISQCNVPLCEGVPHISRFEMTL